MLTSARIHTAAIYSYIYTYSCTYSCTCTCTYTYTYTYTYTCIYVSLFAGYFAAADTQHLSATCERQDDGTGEVASAWKLHGSMDCVSGYFQTPFKTIEPKVRPVCMLTFN